MAGSIRYSCVSPASSCENLSEASCVPENGAKEASLLADDPMMKLRCLCERAIFTAKSLFSLQLVPSFPNATLSRMHAHRQRQRRDLLVKAVFIREQQRVLTLSQVSTHPLLAVKLLVPLSLALQVLAISAAHEAHTSSRWLLQVWPQYIPKR